MEVNVNTFTNETNQENLEVKRLIEKLNEKDKVIRQVEKEIKKLTRSKNEIIRIVQEKDKELAEEVMEKIPEIERVITEDEEKKTIENEKPTPARGSKAVNLLKFQDDKTNRMETEERKPIMPMMNIGLIVKDQVVDPSLFNDFQKEIFAYYTNNKEMYSQYDQEDEEPLQVQSIDKVEWQYVLVFKNPDFAKEKQHLDPKTAKRAYFRLFRPDRRISNSRIAYNQENYVYKYILENMIEKENIRGSEGYLFNKGGSLEKDEASNQWKFTDTQPKDLQTLFRNTAIFKINKVLNMKTATLLSEKGDFIYVLIHANEDILRGEADWMEYPLQFEVGATDLVSMEPCDEKLRPYRFVTEGKPAEISQIEEELRGFSTIIYGHEEWETLSTQSIAEQAKISEKEWTAYKHFLDFIQLHKSKVTNLYLKYPELKGLLARELYEAAIEHVKKEFDMELKNVWNYYGVEPNGTFKSYYREYDRILGTDKVDSFWKRYVNSKGEISILSNIDKIKLILSKLFSQLRLDKMKNLGYLENYFPLHTWDYNEARKHLANGEEGKADEKNSLQTDGEQNDNEKAELVARLRQKENNFTYVKNMWRYNIFARIPTNAIRNYFGEKVAFYYEFLSLYTFYLLILSFLGIAVYIIQLREPLPSKVIEYYNELGFKKSTLVIVFNTLYSFAIIIWSTVFLEHWKRRDTTISTEWGQFNYQTTEEVLPSYSGEKRRSPVNDILNETKSSYIGHIIKKLFAYLISLTIVIIVIIIVLLLLYWRNYLVINKVWGAGNRVIVNIPTVLNSIQIALFNEIHGYVARKMNNFENHKTYESYESSLASKIFIFQFVNSFNSLIIISFIKRSIDFMGGCVKTNQFGKGVSEFNFCDEELENQMVTVAIINFATNFSELGIPWLTNWWKNRKNKVDQSHQLESTTNPVEALRKAIDYQNGLGNFNEGFTDMTFHDYMELCVQFGFVNLFALSFTLLPLIAFITNIVEMQVDKTKLLFFLKRPNPISATSIGNWYYILELISFLSIFSNVGILIFTYNNYYQLSEINRLILFMCLIFFYIIAKLVVSRFIPDEGSRDVELQRRQKFIIEKMCDGIDQEAEAKKKYKVDLNIIVVPSTG